MDKIAKERHILILAKPILVELYENFNIIDEQKDNPDAAIELASNEKIGIEITSIDPQKIQQYFRDTKFERDVKFQELEQISQGKHSNKPTKKLSIPLPNTYICDGVKKKQEKYLQYMKSGNYKDIILIAFGEYLGINENFISYYKPWTQYFLTKKSFSFDKVIYVCEKSGNSILVFDKNLPYQEKPSRNLDIEAGITKISSPILPIGKKINLKNIFNNEPSIKPKQNRKSKKKRKIQKQSRRKNR